MRRAPYVIAAAILAGCATDPLPAPDVPAATRYTPAPVALPGAVSGVAGGEAQRLAPSEDIPGEWWTLFQSPALDDMLRRALTASPTLARAQGRLRQAQ